MRSLTTHEFYFTDELEGKFSAALPLDMKQEQKIEQFEAAKTALCEKFEHQKQRLKEQYYEETYQHKILLAPVPEVVTDAEGQPYLKTAFAVKIFQKTGDTNSEEKEVAKKVVTFSSKNPDEIRVEDCDIATPDINAKYDQFLYEFLKDYAFASVTSDVATDQARLWNFLESSIDDQAYNFRLRVPGFMVMREKIDRKGSIFYTEPPQALRDHLLGYEKFIDSRLMGADFKKEFCSAHKEWMHEYIHQLKEIADELLRDSFFKTVFLSILQNRSGEEDPTNIDENKICLKLIRAFFVVWGLTDVLSAIVKGNKLPGKYSILSTFLYSCLNSMEEYYLYKEIYPSDAPDPANIMSSFTDKDLFWENCYMAVLNVSNTQEEYQVIKNLLPSKNFNRLCDRLLEPINLDNADSYAGIVKFFLFAGPSQSEFNQIYECQRIIGCIHSLNNISSLHNPKCVYNQSIQSMYQLYLQVKRDQRPTQEQELEKIARKIYESLQTKKEILDDESKRILTELHHHHHQVLAAYHAAQAYLRQASVAYDPNGRVLSQHEGLLEKSKKSFSLWHPSTWFRTDVSQHVAQACKLVAAYEALLEKENDRIRLDVTVEDISALRNYMFRVYDELDEEAFRRDDWLTGSRLLRKLDAVFGEMTQEELKKSSTFSSALGSAVVDAVGTVEAAVQQKFSSTPPALSNSVVLSADDLRLLHGLLPQDVRTNYENKLVEKVIARIQAEVQSYLAVKGRTGADDKNGVANALRIEGCLAKLKTPETAPSSTSGSTSVSSELPEAASTVDAVETDSPSTAEKNDENGTVKSSQDEQPDEASQDKLSILLQALAILAEEKARGEKRRGIWNVGYSRLTLALAQDPLVQWAERYHDDLVIERLKTWFASTASSSDKGKSTAGEAGRLFDRCKLSRPRALDTCYQSLQALLSDPSNDGLNEDIPVSEEDTNQFLNLLEEFISITGAFADRLLADETTDKNVKAVFGKSDTVESENDDERDSLRVSLMQSLFPAWVGTALYGTSKYSPLLEKLKKLAGSTTEKDKGKSLRAAAVLAVLAADKLPDKFKTDDKIKINLATLKTSIRALTDETEKQRLTQMLFGEGVKVAAAEEKAATPEAHSASAAAETSVEVFSSGGAEETKPSWTEEIPNLIEEGKKEAVTVKRVNAAGNCFTDAVFIALANDIPTTLVTAMMSRSCFTASSLKFAGCAFLNQTLQFQYNSSSQTLWQQLCEWAEHVRNDSTEPEVIVQEILTKLYQDGLGEMGNINVMEFPFDGWEDSICRGEAAVWTTDETREQDEKYLQYFNLLARQTQHNIVLISQKDGHLMHAAFANDNSSETIYLLHNGEDSNGHVVLLDLTPEQKNQVWEKKVKPVFDNERAKTVGMVSEGIPRSPITPIRTPLEGGGALPDSPLRESREDESDLTSEHDNTRKTT